jgi:aldehyde dehydrogenase (NAD+)
VATAAFGCRAERSSAITEDEEMLAAKTKLEPGQLLIDGKWVDGAKAFNTINPATGEVLTHIAEGTSVDVDRAAEAARRAFEDPNGAWRKMSSSQRGRMIWKLADLLENNIDEFAELETLDNGKPIFESRYVDMPMVIDVFRYYAGLATKIHGETINTNETAFTYTLREPVGVVGMIVPWNFPLLLASWKLGPALACGNTVVWKPASQTSLTTLRFGKLAMEAGVPAGVINIVTGPGAVGRTMVRHPGIDKIAFTGSTAVGQEIMRNAADTLKRITLELGGKSPNIVFADADIDNAVKGAISGIFYGKGEVCNAGSRLFLESKVKDEFTEKLVARAAKMRPADPLDPKTRLGAIVSQDQMNTVLGYIEAGKKDGAKLVAGGSRVSVDGGKGFFIEPTIFGDVRNHMTIAREEIFGPVLSVLTFDDIDEVIAQANNNAYGLASAVWTRDVKKAHTVSRRLKAGTVWINTYGLMDASLPFGGYKSSGFGRELSAHAVEHYTEMKTVWLNMT